MCFSLVALSDTPVTILDPNARPKHFRIISSSWRGLARSLNEQRAINSQIFLYQNVGTCRRFFSDLVSHFD